MQMTKYEKKKMEIEQADIEYIETPSETLPSKSFNDDGQLIIAMNEAAFSTEAERYVALSHEKAHCDLGTFYSVNAPFMRREWLEHKTMRHTIKKLLPFDSMKAAIAGGVCSNDFELAEYFEVTVELVESAVEYYTGYLGLSFRDEDER